MANASQRRKRVTAVLETQPQDLATDLTYGQVQDLKLVVDNTLNAETQKDNKRKKKMTPTAEKSNTKRIQRTVFDLTAFDDLKLVKDIELPKKPEEVQEALDLLGSKEKLLEVIYKGLVAEVSDQAWDQIEGFRVINEDGELGDVYTGQFADEKKGALINAAILSLAKMQGYEKSLSKEKKAELKEKATAFLRANPAMLQSIQG